MRVVAACAHLESFTSLFLGWFTCPWWLSMVSTGWWPYRGPGAVPHWEIVLQEDVPALAVDIVASPGQRQICCLCWWPSQCTGPSAGAMAETGAKERRGRLLGYVGRRSITCVYKGLLGRFFMGALDGELEGRPAFGLNLKETAGTVSSK